MAAADLATLLFCPAMFMVNDFFQNYELGEIGCKIEGFLLGAFLLTAMRIWRNFDEKWCTENTSVLPMYWHVLISGLVWLPLGVMMICYSAIFYKLDRYEAKVLKRETPISVSYKTKVAKMLFIVLITFIVLRGPFTALVFIRNQLLKESKINQISTSFQILWQTPILRVFCKAPQKKKKKKKLRRQSINKCSTGRKLSERIDTCATRRKSTLTIFRPFVVRIEEDTENTKVGMLSTKIEPSEGSSGFIVSNMIINDAGDAPKKKDNTLNPENFI
uniref:Putative 7 transmembrane receptor n=1 Tax=Lutzomyia longipalpis TaxID=7200 RepID=A0A1B0CUX5_LUTLO